MSNPNSDGVEHGLGAPGAAAVESVIGMAARYSLPTVPTGLDDRAWRSVARAEGRLWLIDERDADGAVVGTTERHPDDKKMNRRGGKRGLILPDGELAAYAGSSREEPVLVCEGATDTAALFGLGFDVVGAPMAGHCGEWLAALMAGRHACIVSDADGTGRRGAAKIAEAIAARCESVRIIEPPNGHEDARAAVIAGATRGDFDALIRAAPEWSAPKAEIAAPEPPIFDAGELFPPGTEVLSRFVCEVARATQTPAEMPAMMALGLLSGCISNVAIVHAYGDHTEPAPVWMLCVAKPGARKTQVFRELEAPISKWQVDEAERLGPEIVTAEQEMRIRKARLVHLQGLAAKEKDGGKATAYAREAIELAHEIAENPVPTAPVLLASDSTPESLAQQMGANHGRAIIATAENDAFDKMLGLYTGGQKNFGIYLKGHGGDSVRISRVGREGDTIERPALALAMLCQPDAVRDMWTDPQAKGRGLLARFAVCLPEDLVGDREPRTEGVDPDVREQYGAAVRGLLSIPVPEQPHVVRLDVEADALLHDFQREVEHRLGYADLADRREWGGKLVGMCLRIALSLHAYATWGRTGRVCSTPINAATMAASIAWGRFFADAELHARTEILSEVANPVPHKDLLAWLRKQHDQQATAREVSRGLAAFQGRGGADRSRNALRQLKAAGHGEWVPVSDGKTMAFRLFPEPPQ